MTMFSHWSSGRGQGCRPCTSSPYWMADRNQLYERLLLRGEQRLGLCDVEQRCVDLGKRRLNELLDKA